MPFTDCLLLLAVRAIPLLVLELVKGRNKVCAAVIIAGRPDAS
jgi:hypothetical protein